MIGGDNGSDGNVLKSKGDGTMEWGTIIINPTFSSFDYPGDDTALDPAGGQSLVINGTGFNPSVTVTIGGTTCSSITRNSSEQLTVTTPAKSAGSQAVVITNTDGGSASTNVSYNGIPAFTNAAGSLGSVKDGESINLSAAATEPDGGAITYAITSGALPSGVTLNTSTGAITGTAPSVSADTTSNFTVTATDDENQSTARAYSITVTPELPSDKFKIVTYTGNGSTQSITGVGFKPDFVWIKERGGAENNYVQDSTRGSTKQIYTNLNNSEFNETGAVTSFDSDGFTMGSYSGINNSSDTYIAWCWKSNGGTTSSNTDGTNIDSTVQVNSDAGFSIVQFTTPSTFSGSNTVGHGLGATPDMILIKATSTTEDWYVYHTSTGLNKTTRLNTTAAVANATYLWGTVNDTVFNPAYTSTSPITNIAYCFKSIDGFSKFGSYTGNGSTNGPIVETGFEPAFVMIKRTDSTGVWVMLDNKRNLTNPRNSSLYANSSAQEDTGSTSGFYPMNFYSNGFQPIQNTGDYNANNATYIYMAFAEDPDTTAPTLADSFSTATYTGTGSDPLPITGLGFKPGLVWIKTRDQAREHILSDIVRGPNKEISSSDTSAEEARGVKSFDNDGFTLDNATFNYNNNGEDYVAWAFKADDNEPTIFGGPAKAVYKFEDNLNDVTGNNNSNASVSITYNSSGKFNKSVDFNGTSSYFTVSSLNNLFNTWVSISYSLWIKTTDSSAQFLVGTSTDEQNYKALASISSGKLTPVTRKSGTVYSASSSTSINDGNWHHIVITYDNDNGITKGYVDGVEEVSFATGGSSSGSLTIHNVSVGANYQSGNGNFYNGLDGEIDQLRFYNGVVSDIGVAALYAETTSDNDDLTLGGPPEIIISANANAGFSIVKYEGNGSNNQVPHGLSAAPEMVITKRTDTVANWTVGQFAALGTDGYLKLNTTDSKITATNVWNDTAPTSTVVNIGTSSATNTSGGEYISYCFHSVSGYSKIGSYSGTGSSNSITGLGFQPDFVMIKSATTAEDWLLFDSVRGNSIVLYPNKTDAEASYSTFVFDSNGFTIPQWGSINASGETYIYMAIKIN